MDSAPFKTPAQGVGFLCTYVYLNVLAWTDGLPGQNCLCHIPDSPTDICKDLAALLAILVWTDFDLTSLSIFHSVFQLFHCLILILHKTTDELLLGE